jgi:hypothetical protein
MAEDFTKECVFASAEDDKNSEAHDDSDSGGYQSETEKQMDEEWDTSDWNRVHIETACETLTMVRFKLVILAANTFLFRQLW